MTWLLAKMKLEGRKYFSLSDEDKHRDAEAAAALQEAQAKKSGAGDDPDKTRRKTKRDLLERLKISGAWLSTVFDASNELAGCTA